MNELRSLKQCSRCNLVKSSMSFHVKIDRIDGLAPHCTDCEKAIQASRREARKAAEAAPDPISVAMAGWVAPYYKMPPARSCEVWTL
jgi:hypothetical protein